MNPNSFYEAFTCIDLYGVHYHFYADKKGKIYSPIGGILSLITILLNIIAFIILNKDEFLHNNPLSTTSTSKEPYRNVKFEEEKIWVPFRIRDYRQRTFDFNRGVLYPVVYYYQAKRNYTKDALDLTYTILNYTLCNESSMANNTDSFILDIELDKLYCINMDDLIMGGGWDTEYINYIEVDLYTCQDGINFDENNPKCSSYDKIMEAAGPDNSFFFDLYFPVVDFQPMNKTKPIFIRYDNIFYHLSRYSNKIQRIYLQQHLLLDDDGWLFKHIKNTSFWGLLSLSGDSYASGNEKDLMAEGSSSRLYSFNVYLYFDVIYYYRSYKKIFLLFSEAIPIMSTIHYFFRFITKFIKIFLGHNKIAELLFENEIIKPDEINESENNKLKKKIIIENKIIDISKNNQNLKRNNYIDNSTKTNKEKEKNDNSSIKMISPSYPKELNKLKNIYFQSQKDSLNNNKNHKRTQKYYQSFDIDNKNNINENPILNNANINKSIINIEINEKEFKKKTYEVNSNNKDPPSYRKNNNKKKKLFDYRYCLYSIFMSNINVYKQPHFCSYKFILIYKFVDQLLDISSYIFLLKENQIFKKILMLTQYKHFLENIKKININDDTFNLEMLETLKSKKLNILNRTKK